MQPKRLWAYVWYPAILILWLVLHFYLSAPADPYTMQQIKMSELNFTFEDINKSALLSPIEYKQPLKMETVLHEFAADGQLFMWKYAYYGIWLWLIYAFMEYLSQFNARYWWFKKVTRNIFENYAFIIIMAYVVIYW